MGLTKSHHCSSFSWTYISLFITLVLFGAITKTWAQSEQSYEVDSLLKKAWNQSSTDYELSLLLADSALEMATIAENKSQTARGYWLIGLVQSKSGSPKKAESNYLQALELYKQIKDSNKIAQTHYQMGNLYRVLDRTDEASVMLFKALGEYKTLNDSSRMGDALLSIGILHGFTKVYDKAEEYMLMAQEVYSDIGLEERLILVLSNLGTLYNITGKHQEALEVTEKVKDYYGKYGPEERYALALHNLGLQYSSIGEHDKSNEYNLQSQKIYEKQGNSYQLSGIELNMARNHIAKNRLQLAEELSLSALQRAKDLKSYNLEYNAYEVLYMIYEKKEDFKTALDYRLKYEDARDSVFKSEKQAQIAELETRYQSELKEQELKELSSQNELSQLQLRKKSNQQYILGGVLLLALGIVVLMFNQFRIKKNNNKLLQDKNQIIQKNLDEKEVLLKEIHHRVKNNLQFISSLLNLQSRHVSDQTTLKVLQDCKNRVNSMAMVHQRLYQEENLKGVYMPFFVTNLLESLHHSYRKDKTRIEAEINIEPIHLDVDTAIPIGLILNELITNVFKYAFEGDSTGNITIGLESRADHLRLQVKDDGKGFPKNFELKNVKSFGLQLVESFAEKLGTKLNIESSVGANIFLDITKYKTS